MTILSYYVNSATGSNSNDGSIGSPWLTLPYAITNASWSTAQGIRFYLTGTFTLTGPLDATGSTSYPLVQLALIGPATINLNFTGTTGLFDDFMYRRSLVVNCTIQCQSTCPVSFAGAIAAEFHGCTLRSGTAMGTYWDFGGSKYSNCVFVGEKASQTNYIQFFSGGVYQCCEFKNINYWYLTTTQTCFEHCKIYGPAKFSSGLIDINDITYRTVFSMRHCSFAGVNGTVIGNLSRWQVELDECVFADCTEVSDGDLRLSSVYRYNTATGSYRTLYDGSDALLTASPYADPANSDWTLSAELAAIVGEDGMTPGAVQSTGGGTSRPSHPMYQQVIG